MSDLEFCVFEALVLTLACVDFRRMEGAVQELIDRIPQPERRAKLLRLVSDQRRGVEK